MKTFFLLLFCSIVISTSVHAQVALQNQVDPSGYKPYEIKIKRNFKNESKYFIRLKDRRPDTTRLGFMRDNFKQLYFHFEKPAIPYLSEKLNSNQSYSDTITIVLDKFWVYESIIPQKGNLFRPDEKLVCFGRIQADVFLHKDDHLIKLMTYDSTIDTRGYLANNVDYLLSKNMNILLDIIGRIVLPTRLQGGNASSKSKDFGGTNFPIQTASVYKDGVYLTLDDFLNNDPASAKFTYMVKKKTELYDLQENRPDDSLYTKYNWGFCLNGQPYMRVGNSFSCITKIENSFEIRAVDLARFYAYKGLSPKDAGFAAAAVMLGVPSLMGGQMLQALSSSNKFYAQYENIAAFKLDLETGKLY